MLFFYYEDAVAQYSNYLATNNVLLFSSLNSSIPNHAIIENSIIDRCYEEDDRANLSIIIQFKEYVQGDDGLFTDVSRTMNLVFFNPEGDTKWTARMKSRVWRGKYPDTIAVDRETGDIYLVFITPKATLELCHYSKIQLSKLENILMSVNHNEPFYIFVDDKAMFDVIDGAEGYNHLFNKTYIVFNSAQEVRVYRREQSEDLGDAISIIKATD